MLSVILPRYCLTPETAATCLANLRQLRAVQSVPTELVVVDNGSSEHLPLEDREALNLVYAAWPENHGIAPAWNLGRRLATGDVLAFLTVTTTVEPGWDAALQAVAQSGRVIAMPFTNGEQPYGLGITGWCWAITTALADVVGPFDETFVPVQYEDTDFFHRAIYQHGVELVSVRGAHVRRERGRQTLNTAPWAARFNLIHMANRFRYAWKHDLDPDDVPPFWKAPLRIVEAA